MPSAGITTFRTDYLFCRSNQQRHAVWRMEDSHMRQSLYGILIGAAAVVATSNIAFAGEQKLVTKPIDVKVTEIANVEGQTVASGKYFGVAVFKDGRIGVKEFVNSYDLLKGSGSYYGYSTYT